MNWAEALRAQLRVRAEARLESAPQSGYRSLGTKPTVLFTRSEDGAEHRNFYTPAWRSICANEEWSRRLAKSHSQKKALPLDRAAMALELDSSNSSDALLMNCFCAPTAAAIGAKVLGAQPSYANPVFGWNPKIQLLSGELDDTEVDMRLGDTLVEAKLTEKDFTERETSHVFRYRALAEVFNVELLPQRPGFFIGYQLIRNVLAAAQHGLRLVVLIDGRRPDLLQEWWNVHAAIATPMVRARCGVRLWQQLAAEMPADLRAFLESKYGLVQLAG